MLPRPCGSDDTSVYGRPEAQDVPDGRAHHAGRGGADEARTAAGGRPGLHGARDARRGDAPRRARRLPPAQERGQPAVLPRDHELPAAAAAAAARNHRRWQAHPAAPAGRTGWGGRSQRAGRAQAAAVRRRARGGGARRGRPAGADRAAVPGRLPLLARVRLRDRGLCGRQLARAAAAADRTGGRAAARAAGCPQDRLRNGSRLDLKVPPGRARLARDPAHRIAPGRRAAPAPGRPHPGVRARHQDLLIPIRHAARRCLLQPDV
mmetsp:Transcript_5198/g.17245  ORF Transcript_5198/g.17245 Transcript_5198/m.17245 type:complete len:264 (+) Transcript_5198:4334-5125(+)